MYSLVNIHAICYHLLICQLAVVSILREWGQNEEQKNSRPNFCLQSPFYLYFKHLKTNLFRILHVQGQISSVYYTQKQTYFYTKRLSSWPHKCIKRLSAWRLSPILCSKAVFIKFISSWFKRLSNLRLVSRCILSSYQIYKVIMTLKLK